MNDHARLLDSIEQAFLSLLAAAEETEQLLAAARQPASAKGHEGRREPDDTLLSRLNQLMARREAIVAAIEALEQGGGGPGGATGLLVPDACGGPAHTARAASAGTHQAGGEQEVAARIADTIRRVQEVDRRCVRLAEALRDEARTELEDIRTHRDMWAGYRRAVRSFRIMVPFVDRQV